ncbi:hypothetical protein PHLCEN_2v2494 [Hermanssonia centrifuga]|uniref:Uncharacterized protein n=1 Tax=Hermanssonia centrifuga TaxID=98765 RepID=A0A2R6RLT8_9APHY|nr:hypothetical protein PHLCEN_2v2494 [Hermanssonia centrifuga]
MPTIRGERAFSGSELEHQHQGIEQNLNPSLRALLTPTQILREDEGPYRSS